MTKTLQQIIFTLLLSIPLFSYSSEKDSNFPETIVNQFAKLWRSVPQEKLYLHTDKPYYSAGENIWFKGYLVNATTHKPTALSQFIYVELINRIDTVVYRVKIRMDSLGFSGYLKIKPELPRGYYTLRAYTYWMQNATSDFFFRKSIYIGNPIDDTTTSQIAYGEAINGIIPVSITITNANKSPLTKKKVIINQNWNKAPRKKITLETNVEGKINWQISIDPSDNSKKSIDITIDEPTIKHKNKFFVPEFSCDYDVQFFPESGVLLTNRLQTIAFKAIGKDGLSVEIKGKIFTNNNEEEITEFSSFNKGMGKFIIESQTNASYYAIVKSDKGIEKRFELPPSQPEGVAIHLAYNKDKILYEFINQTNRLNNSLYLLIHSRGKVFVVQALKAMFGQISTALLPSGIASFSIIDSIGNILCERHTFIKNIKEPTIEFITEKANYGIREMVNINLNVKSSLRKSTGGNFSISVTDSRIVILDTLSNNMMSYLLLSSDIKGYIEDPATYFADNLISTREKLDLLMMTQGWHRFKTAEILKSKYPSISFYFEAGQALSGRVTNILQKPSKNCDIIMLTPYKSTIKWVKTDSLGRYMISGIEFPDSTTFILKAKKKSLTDVEIIPDPDNFPQATNYIPVTRGENINAPNEYFIQSKEKYYYEGGMRVVNLDEVVVTAEKKKSESNDNFYSGMADSQITAENIEKLPRMSVMTILSTIAGVQVSGDQISIRGNQGKPLILIDNFVTEETSELNFLNSYDIEDISVFKGSSASIFGLRSGNGVIAITLKKGVVSKASTPISYATIVPLGYQKPSEFYIPKYEIDSIYSDKKPDLRTTIYWNPKLVADTTGFVHVKFYSADKAHNYSVIIEGITNDGEICSYVGIIKREEN